MNMDLHVGICSVALCLLTLLCRNGCAKLAPAFIHPCNDTSSACLVKATQDAIPDFVKGLPELGLPVLDPFVIDKLSIPLSGLTFTFYQGKVSGFKNAKVDNVISDLEKRHFELDFHCNLTIRGKYDAVGRILLFPINGDGDAKIKLNKIEPIVTIMSLTAFVALTARGRPFLMVFDNRNVSSSAETNLKMKVKINTKYVRDDNGLNYFGLKDYKYSFNYGDRVSFDLTNIFKDNIELSRTVLEFLNNNWKTVAEEFGGPIVEYAVKLAITTIEKFFQKVPYEELINVPIPKF